MEERMMESKIEKAVKKFFTPMIPIESEEIANEMRQARKSLCKILGINMKQLRKKRVLASYVLRNGVFIKSGITL